jgi:hypothetical protein
MIFMAGPSRWIDADRRPWDIEQGFGARGIYQKDERCRGERTGRNYIDPDMTCMFYRRQRENGFNTYDPMESGRNPGKISLDVEPIGKIGRCPQRASSIAPSFLS